MCYKKVQARIKFKMFKVMVRPAILYGMEAVVVTKAQEDKMQVAEMKMLRWSLGLTRLDKERNENVRKKVQVGELKGKLRKKRLRWLEHVIRREANYVGKRVKKIAVGTRRRGRPRRRWKDFIREDLEVTGLKEEDAVYRES